MVYSLWYTLMVYSLWYTLMVYSLWYALMVYSLWYTLMVFTKLCSLPPMLPVLQSREGYGTMQNQKVRSGPSFKS